MPFTENYKNCRTSSEPQWLGGILLFLWLLRSFFREEQGQGDLETEADPLDRVDGQLPAALLRVFQRGLGHVADPGEAVQRQIPLRGQFLYARYGVHAPASFPDPEKRKNASSSYH